MYIDVTNQYESLFFSFIIYLFEYDRKKTITPFSVSLTQTIRVMTDNVEHTVGGYGF